MAIPDGAVHEKGTFSLVDLINNAKKNPDFQKTGAIALFIGVVRGVNKEGNRVQKLELEAYEEKADEELMRICSDLESQPGITDVEIHHLLGEFSAGEDLVYVLVAGSHRENVFPVLREAVERYKKEAPIFKKETTTTKKGEKSVSWSTENRTSSP